jgi:hypothetical protein
LQRRRGIPPPKTQNTKTYTPYPYINKTRPTNIDRHNTGNKEDKSTTSTEQYTNTKRHEEHKYQQARQTSEQHQHQTPRHQTPIARRVSRTDQQKNRATKKTSNRRKTNNKEKQEAGIRDEEAISRGATREHRKQEAQGSG